MLGRRAQPSPMLLSPGGAKSALERANRCAPISWEANSLGRRGSHAQSAS